LPPAGEPDASGFLNRFDECDGVSFDAAARVQKANVCDAEFDERLEVILCKIRIVILPTHGRRDDDNCCSCSAGKLNECPEGFDSFASRRDRLCATST